MRCLGGLYDLPARSPAPSSIWAEGRILSPLAAPPGVEDEVAPQRKWAVTRVVKVGDKKGAHPLVYQPLQSTGSDGELRLAGEPLDEVRS